MCNFDPYIVRPVEFIDQVESDGWRLKVYAISATSLPVPNEIVSAGLENVISHLPQPAVTENRYGVGFLVVHQGTMRNWYLLDWWEQEDIIHHKLFSSPLDNPRNISVEPDRTLVACVHELRVVNFESEAWIKTVLCENDKSSFEDYMQVHMRK